MTYREWLEAAYAKSMKNQPGEIANEETELLGQMRRTLSGVYAIAARWAPGYFGEESGPVAHNGTAWPRPTQAENVFIVSKVDGTEVAVVPIRDKLAELSKPSVYELGQGYRLVAGTPSLTVGDSLVFTYAKSPDVPASLDDTLDALWNDTFDDLLIFEIALFLAYKDGREDEYGPLSAERDRWLMRFAHHLEHHTSCRVARFAQVQQITAETARVVGSLLPSTPA